MSDKKQVKIDLEAKVESAFIIEKHEDGSECRKCSNCACANNKMAKIDLEASLKKDVKILLDDDKSSS